MDRERQWRKRCASVIGYARDLQFKEVADTIRLGAIYSVLTAAELADINARIKAKTAAQRARIAALRATPPAPKEETR